MLLNDLAFQRSDYGRKLEQELNLQIQIEEKHKNTATIATI
jgi:hypothetical protein